jgi:hypothetical protein
MFHKDVADLISTSKYGSPTHRLTDLDSPYGITMQISYQAFTGKIVLD